ncbi:MAG: hypothetical protein P1P88_19900 [Bacteroidales bacterium]|nr:hypothetical protein [Bacteroidales bacterium]
MKNIFTVVLLLIFPNLFSQKSLSFSVVDSVSKQTIPFIKIVVCGKDKGAYSDEKGLVKIDNLSDDDTIFIYNIFYESKLMPIKNLLNIKQIMFSPKPLILNEVVIKSSKYKEVEIGYSKSKSNGSFGTQIIGTEIAVLIRPGNIQNAYINCIILKFKKIVKNTLIRVHLYQNEKGKPGTEIYLKDNLITVSEKNEVKFDIVNHYIKLPIEGLFVSMEWIGNSKAKGETYSDTEFKSSPRVRADIVNKRSKAIGLVRTYGKWESLMEITQQENKVYVPLFGLLVEEHK